MENLVRIWSHGHIKLHESMEGSFPNHCWLALGDAAPVRDEEGVAFQLGQWGIAEQGLTSDKMFEASGWIEDGCDTGDFCPIERESDQVCV